MTLLIIFRILFSASASVVQKRLLLNAAPMAGMWTLTYALLFIPAAAFWLFQSQPVSSAFWWNILLAGVIDSIGNVAMVAALKTMDLSVFGPLNGLRALIALIFGWIFLGENPSIPGYAGIGLTIFGTFLLMTSEKGAPGEKRNKLAWQALGLRLAGLSLGVLGAVYLKRASALASAEMTVAFWIAFGVISMLLLTTAFWPEEFRLLLPSLQKHGKWLLLHASFFLALQWFSIKIFQKTMLSYSFVFFQLAMVLQVLAGSLFFKEKEFVRRTIAAVIMGGGSALILWKG